MQYPNATLKVNYGSFINKESILCGMLQDKLFSPAL